MSIKVGIRCDNGVARIKIRRFQPTRRDDELKLGSGRSIFSRLPMFS